MNRNIKITSFEVISGYIREFRRWRISFALPSARERPLLCGEDANPYQKHKVFWAGSMTDGSPENEKSTSFEVLHSLVTHPGIEPEFPA